MLILSRRQGQRILFPKLNIAVQVLASKGNNTRLGIEAPSDIAVVREEVAVEEPATAARAASESKARHDLRGTINMLAMAMHVVEKQLKAGMTADAERTLQDAQAFLERLPAPEPPPTPLLADASPKPLEALLVEDNPNEQALLSSYLRLSGFRVQTVHDGYEALEFLAGHQRPDFLLLDMRLPRFDGPATVSAIRQNPAYQGLRIFAVTGSTPGDFEMSAGGKGVDAWFQKPLNPKRIVEAMSAAVSHN